VIGADGVALLSAVMAPTAPAWLREVPAVETLRRVWVQHYALQDGTVCWRADEELPPATLLINSPDDPEARYGQKRSTAWVGDTAPLTETCADDGPPLITHVATTGASSADGAVTTPMHAALAARDLLPAVHLVDARDTDAELVVTSRTASAVDLLGPLRGNAQWQAHTAGGCDPSCFQIDWLAQRATCPEGHTSTSWTALRDRRQHDLIKISFARRTCRVCPSRPRCTRAAANPRSLTLQPQGQHEALLAARRRQTTAAFKKEYARRAGVEGTLSHGVRCCGLRRARYGGSPRLICSRYSLLRRSTTCGWACGCWTRPVLPGAPRVSAPSWRREDEQLKHS
jgi:Transposase DDE domain